MCHGSIKISAWLSGQLPESKFASDVKKKCHGLFRWILEIGKSDAAGRRQILEISMKTIC